MSLYNDLRERIEHPFDDERVWITEFDGHTIDGGVSIDDVEEIVEDYVDRVERTMDAVGHIERHQRKAIGQEFGPETVESVVLFFVIGRRADKEVFEWAMEFVQRDIIDHIHRGD